MTLVLQFLDVAPDPVSSGISAVLLILIGVIAVMISGAAVLGFVFLLKFVRRAKAPAASPVTSQLQPNNPNQP